MHCGLRIFGMLFHGELQKLQWSTQTKYKNRKREVGRVISTIESYKDFYLYVKILLSSANSRSRYNRKEDTG